MEQQIEPIRGKIAKVLNTRDVAINVGKGQGVEVDMLFDIVVETEVVDPDTEESLGIISTPKARVKITRVDDKWSIASTYRTKRVNVGGSGMEPLRLPDVSTMFRPPRWETRYETLRSTGSFERVVEPLDESDSYVQTGDLVIQAIDAKE